MPKPKPLTPLLTETPEPVAQDESTLNFLNRKLSDGSIVEKLGLDITKPGDTVPKSGDVPRIFLFREGKVSSLEENQISVGSREFWQAAVIGQVFAYPAGEKHPVQLQLSDYNGFSPRLQFSDPLDPEKPPAAKMYKEPPRPKWYHRWFPFGRNRRVCEAYDRFKAAEAKQPELTRQCVKAIKDAYGDKRDPETLSKEADEALLAQSLFVQRKLNREVQSNLDSRRMELEKVEKLIGTAKDIYGPDPKRQDKLTKPEGKRPDPKHTGDMYTKRQFELLKPIDLKGVKVGGEQVTDREFSALAMFAALDPKIAIEAQKTVGDVEPVFKAFAADGYSREESGEIIAESVQEMYGRSLMERRSDSGDYFSCAVQPAREKAKQALDAYQQGNKAPLAEILARTVGCMGRDTCIHMDLVEGFYAQNQLAGEMLDLLDRDEDLKKLTAEKYEQHERDFQKPERRFLKSPTFQEQAENIRQVQAMDKLRRKHLEARSALLDAKLKGSELSTEVKQAYARDILKYNLLSQMYTADVRMAYSDKASDANKRNVAYKPFLEHTRDLPGEEQGVGSKIGGSSAAVSPNLIMRGGLKGRMVPKPDALDHVANPKMMEELDEMLDRLIQKDGLDKADVNELSNKLGMHHQRGNDYTKDTLMDKLIEANQQPQQQEAGQPDVPHVQKAQEGPAEEKQEEQQIIQ